MPDAEDYSEFEDEELNEITRDQMGDDYEDDDDPEFNSLTELQKSMFENRVIQTFVRNAFEFGGSSTLLEVLTQVERKMGWRTEIIADKNAVDDYMFYKHETFDEDLWSHYANSDQYHQLVRDVSLISEKTMGEFVDLYSNGTTPKKSFRNVLRRIAWSLFTRL